MKKYYFIMFVIGLLGFTVLLSALIFKNQLLIEIFIPFWGIYLVMFIKQPSKIFKRKINDTTK